MTRILSETRKADRVQMAAAIEALATRLELNCDRREGGTYPGEQCIRLYLEGPGGLWVTVDFDGNSCQPDVHVLSWNLMRTAQARLNPAAFHDSVNPHHGHKATSIAYGFEKLCAELERAFVAATNGTAYVPAAQAA